MTMINPDIGRLWFYLLVVFDLVFSAAAVGVGGLPPHQGDALLLDLLRSQLTDQWWRCEEVRGKKEDVERGRLGFWVWVSFNKRLKEFSRTSVFCISNLYKLWKRGKFHFFHEEDFSRNQALTGLLYYREKCELRWWEDKWGRGRPGEGRADVTDSLLTLWTNQSRQLHHSAWMDNRCICSSVRADHWTSAWASSQSLTTDQ